MIYVLGLGNVLMGDDGFGPAVVRGFDAAYDVGPDVDIVDLGTPGLDLIPWLYDADAVVIIDTVKADAAPGTLRIYDKAAILKHAPAVRVGPHDPGVKDALHATEFAGHGPRDVTLVGVVPLTLAMGTELSKPMRDAVPVAIEAVAATLAGYGVIVTKRLIASDATPWWSAARP